MDSKRYKPTLIGPSPPDHRDHKYKAVLAKKPAEFKSLPQKYNCPGYDTPERDQGPWGTCAAQAAAFTHGHHHLVEYGEWLDFSPAFTYAHRQECKQDRSDVSEGMFMRDLVSIMYKRGCISEDSLPYGKVSPNSLDIFKDNETLKEYYSESIKHRIKEYLEVDFEKEEIKAALYNNGPILIAVPVWNYGKEMWKKEFEEQSYKGGHAMVVTGYDEDGIFIRNSWGESWGDSGSCKMLWEDIDCAWELWTTIDEKYDQENVRKMPARPTECPKYTPPKWYEDKTLVVLLALSVGALIYAFYIYS